MITPRRTRLIRAADLTEFRRTILTLGTSYDGERATIVPTNGAAQQLRRTITREGAQGNQWAAPHAIVTRDALYDLLYGRLTNAPRRLNAFERDTIAQAAAESARLDSDVSFELRPGLVEEILRFYDQLRRQNQRVDRFEELIEQALDHDIELEDRGAERMWRQTQFLARTFREYERRVADLAACDEHGMRDALLRTATVPPLRHIVVTTADWIADPDGLFAADFDVLARLPDLATLDLVCSERTLATGFDERLQNWWPGLEVLGASDVLDPGPYGAAPHARPYLLVPEAAPADQQWFIERDREEELVAVARRIRSARRNGELTPLNRIGVVFKGPLPYLYLAPDTLGAAGIPFQAADALPLAAEPAAAAIDLVLDFVEAAFSRSAIVALLKAPQFIFVAPTPSSGAAPAPPRLTPEHISALDRCLSQVRYLGDLARLDRLELGEDRLSQEAQPALDQARIAARELAPLLTPAPASVHLRRLSTFLESHFAPLADDLPVAPRARRGREAVIDVLHQMTAAHAALHDPEWTIEDLAAAMRRWLGHETFATDDSGQGVRLLDDQAARYLDCDDLTIVGLVDHEWPSRSRRNIFYPPTLLRSLGWPSEGDRAAAANARLLDLIESPARRVRLSTFTLDDESLVSRSLQLDDVYRAKLSTVVERAEGLNARIFPDEALTSEAPAAHGSADAGEWLSFRQGKPPVDSPEFHGTIGPLPARAWSVSALETYLGCPFRFFAQHVLALAEEPDDEEFMDPRRQGQLVHAVFEAFFREWQTRGLKAITAENIDLARTIFAAIAKRALAELPDAAEAELERARLLGSAGAAGLGEAVLRMEAERPTPVVARLLEHRLEGTFSITTRTGSRQLKLRGKADRIDLLQDGTFRLIDYKLGWPPNRARALQLPIYALCAEQRLDGHLGRTWTLGEAAYLAFKGPRRVVPLFAVPGDRAKVLDEAQERLADTIDAIERGQFPPTPDDVFRCETCSYSMVCRKDYVGDV